MTFNFGDNLRALRLQKGFTQEKAADFFRVTPQSVSRWENNSSFPDLFLLPEIASLYEVTTDQLLGADFQQTAKQKEQEFQKREKAHDKKEFANAYHISRQLYEHFPNDREVLDCAIRDSYLMGFYCTDEHRIHYFHESVKLSRRLYALSADLNEQCFCIRNIAVCYQLSGDNINATDWVQKLPSLWHSRENVAFSILENYGSADLKQDMTGAVHVLYRLLHKEAADTESASEKKHVYEKIIQFLQLFSDEKEFAFCEGFIKKTEQMKENLMAESAK